MATPSEKQLREDISAILKNADLSQLSAKKVRKELEEKHKIDLSERKKEIDELVMELLNEAQSHDDSVESVEQNGDEGSQSNGATGSGSDEALDDESDESEFEAPVDRGPKRKKKSKGASPKKSKKSNNTDEPVDDEALARQLQEQESGGRRTRHKSTPRSKTAKEDKPKRKSGNSTYSRPCQLSEDLANIMGTDQMPRKDVVKKMWEIVKERNLQDPTNRQFMICDDELYKVFGRKRVKTFGMMKYLSAHIFNPE